MDWNTILADLGLPGLIIAGLVWDRVRLVRRNDELVNLLLSQSKGHAEQMLENTRTLEKAAEALKAHA